MQTKFVDDRENLILTVDWEEDEEWGGLMPTKGEQIWITNKGLYEVSLVRWRIIDGAPQEILVKLSFIRTQE